MLARDPFAWKLVVLDSASSTNDEAHRLARGGAAQGTVVLAERQTAGRGRNGSSWYSQPGLSLQSSALFRPTRPTAELARWSIAAAAAACLACRDVGAADVDVKWPNDVRWRGLKIAGTLAEARGAGNETGWLVLGTGFNVNQSPDDFPAEIKNRAASVLMARGEPPVEREELAASFLRHLGALARSLLSGDWDGVLRAWLPLAPGASGTRVRVTPARSGGAPLDGTTRGLDSSGALRVERADGTIVVVHLAESVTYLEA